MYNIINISFYYIWEKSIILFTYYTDKFWNFFLNQLIYQSQSFTILSTKLQNIYNFYWFIKLFVFLPIAEHNSTKIILYLSNRYLLWLLYICYINYYSHVYKYLIFLLYLEIWRSFTDRFGKFKLEKETKKRERFSINNNITYFMVIIIVAIILVIIFGVIRGASVELGIW